ncbi:MAG: chemotaxis protein CheW [Desulfuromonadaceae bacterium]|nr:chemotaxis protein CheW [Desulfuromonas sp.]MDY0185103.1 chemotaxis protein CheW [Desulfuromonadaceae bacterium]
MAVEDQSSGNQYLTFSLDSEMFALPVSQVREILEFTHMTRIPQTPAYMRGVINLRDKVVPVIDMRAKFGLEVVTETVDTCIIIVQVLIDAEALLVGALVDSVQEVLELNQEQIEPPPRMGVQLNTEFLRGMARVDEGFALLLDIDKVFSCNEIAMIRQSQT